MTTLILSVRQSNAFNQNNHSTAHLVYNYFLGGSQAEKKKSS
jgi:hypothetical protein